MLFFRAGDKETSFSSVQSGSQSDVLVVIATLREPCPPQAVGLRTHCNSLDARRISGPLTKNVEKQEVRIGRWELLERIGNTDIAFS
jgi:hypothetical protein